MLIKSLSPAGMSRLQLKERYRIDLSADMAECEANYFRFKKLLNDSSDECRFLVQGKHHSWLQLIQVIERSPYTTTLSWRQIPLIHSSPWLSSPKLTVRLYEDAKLAEVLAWENHRRLRPRYDYPNKAMYLADEKRQLNRFLAEWLSLCLHSGQSADLHFVTPETGRNPK